MDGAGKKDKPGLVGGPASSCAMSQWVRPAPVTQPCMAFIFALALCAKKAKHEVALPSDTRFHCCWGRIEHAKPLSSLARASPLQSPAASPKGWTTSHPRLEKSVLNNCCDSSCGLWLGGLSGQDVVKHKQDKRTVANGTGNTAGGAGLACSPLPSLTAATGGPGPGTSPPSSPANARRRLRSCLTSDVFGPGLKMSVDVLLPHDKCAGV